HGDAEPSRLRAALLSGGERRFPLVPLEHLAPFVERFADERAGHVALASVRVLWTERRLAGWRVDLVDFDLVDAELSRRLGDHRLDDADALHAARLALRRLRRRVGDDRHAAPAHRLRLIRER